MELLSVIQTTAALGTLAVLMTALLTLKRTLRRR